MAPPEPKTDCDSIAGALPTPVTSVSRKQSPATLPLNLGALMVRYGPSVSLRLPLKTAPPARQASFFENRSFVELKEYEFRTAPPTNEVLPAKKFSEDSTPLPPVGYPKSEPNSTLTKPPPRKAKLPLMLESVMSYELPAMAPP